MEVGLETKRDETNRDEKRERSNMNQEGVQAKNRKNQALAGLIAIGLIRGYQRFLSPLTGQNCRFYPTCSHYALEAYQQYGLIRATGLTLARLLKCHPFHEGGVDQLPKPSETPEYGGQTN